MPAHGVIEGGWEFVWGVYGATASMLLFYAVSVHLRLRAERARAAREQTDKNAGGQNAVV